MSVPSVMQPSGNSHVQLSSSKSSGMGFGNRRFSPQEHDEDVARLMSIGTKHQRHDSASIIGRKRSPTITSARPPTSNLPPIVLKTRPLANRNVRPATAHRSASVKRTNSHVVSKAIPIPPGRKPIRKSPSSDSPSSSSTDSSPNSHSPLTQVSPQTPLQLDLESVKLEIQIAKEKDREKEMESVVSRIFEVLKDRKRFDFIKQMPKLRHHSHLGGATYPETYLKHAIEKKYWVDRTSFLCYPEAGGNRILAKDLELEENTDLWELCKKKMTSKSEKSPDAFFKAFVVIESWQQGMSLERRIVPYIKHCLIHNTIYDEAMIDIRAGNRKLPQLPEDFMAFEQDVREENFPQMLNVLYETGWVEAYLESQMSMVDIAERNTIEELEKEGFHFNLPLASLENPVSITYKVEIVRTLPDLQIFAEFVGAMAWASGDDTRIGGIDLVGQENSPGAINHYPMQKKMIDFLYRNMGEPNISIHAGELPLKGSVPADCTNHIFESIKYCHAKHIGHGVAVRHEHNWKTTIDLMRKEKILVEINPTSNKVILGLDIGEEEHPLKDYIEHDIPFSINTDNEAVLGADHTAEFEAVVNTYNLTYLQLKKIARNTAEYAHIRFAPVSQLVNKVNTAFKKFEEQCINDYSHLLK